jgi:SSS family solute:Na+ symporter
VSPTVLLLLLYGAALVGVGLWASRRVSGSSQFFVAGRSLSGSMVFATMLAANIGAGSTVGAAGLAYRSGLSAWWWSGSAAIGCLAMGLVVAPRLYRLAAEHQFLTVGDFLEWRFDRTVRVVIAAVLWIGTLSLLAGQLLAMAWAFEVVAGAQRATGVLAAAVILVAYFGRGGMQAAVVVNVVQLATKLVGFALAVPFAWSAAGGWSGLAAAAGPERAASFGDVFGMGLSGILGLAVVFVPSFIVSPGLHQKAFSARSAGAARGAALGNAAALAVFAFVPALLGMAMRALHPALANSELALPLLATEVLPPWLGGLALAALFAAELSAADAVLFMLSTSLSRDLYQAVLRPGAGDADLLRVGRLAVLLGGAASVGLALLLPSVAAALKLFYGVMTAALFVPLVVGLLWRRPSAVHAKVAIAVSIAATLGLLALLRGRPEAEWLPSAVGILLAALVFASAWLRAAGERGAGASIGKA